jgi:hypothetical protein
VRGNPHAAFDVAGAGNVAWSRWCDTRRRKGEATGNTNFDLNRRASPRPYLGAPGGEIPPRDSTLASVCLGMDDGRYRRKADIVRHWREMARSRMTQSGQARLTRAATMPKGLGELIASIRNKTESNNSKPESAVELLT